jgi:hypothetical protein
MSIAMISATIWLLLWGGLVRNTGGWASFVLIKALPFGVGLWCAWELIILEVSSKV